MINAISDKLTFLIKSNVDGITDEKAEILYYGLSLIIYETIAQTALFAAAILLGIFKYVLIMTITFGILRACSGGAHARTRPQCFSVYTVSIFGTVYISKYIGPIHIGISIIFLTLNLIVLFLLAPGDTAERPILSKNLKRKQKAVSIMFAIAIFAFALYLKNFDSTIYNILVIINLLVVFLLSPIGYRIMGCKLSSQEQ